MMSPEPANPTPKNEVKKAWPFMMGVSWETTAGHLKSEPGGTSNEAHSEEGKVKMWWKWE